MLKKLRDKKTSKKIWIILSIIILPAFVLWGSGSLLRSRQETGALGSIFGKRVSLLEYQDALQAVKNQAVIQFGDDLSEIQKYINLEAQAWERLLLLAEAKRRKISATDREVIELIQSYPFFQKKGRFDKSAYSYMLDYVFRTPSRIFEEQTRQNIAISKLYKQVTESVNLTDEEIKKEYRKSNEEVSISYIAGLYADFVKNIAPSQEKIKDYFIQNSFKFKQPLSFNIEYISLPTEGENEKTIKDKVESLVLRLNKKEEFKKLAGELGLEIKETGLFSQADPIPGMGWSPEILNLILRAKSGQYLPPIHTDKYYYIIRIKEIKPPYIPDFETIEDKVKETLIKEGSREVTREKLQDCLKELKEQYQLNPQALDFEKFAIKFGLKSGSTDLFKYASYIEGIGASDNFWSATEDLRGDKISEVIDMPSGLYIIKLKSRLPIDEKKFEAEKTEFAKGLLLRKKNAHFTHFTEGLYRKNAKP